jgi:large repetitive protein
VFVNSAPSFTAGPDQSASEDGGAQSLAAWATAISPGPPSDASQSVTFSVTNDNGALFAVAPSVAPDGTLSYTPAADANGSAAVTVTAHDDGGTANGGSDTSAAQTFTITVDPVNDAPAFTAGADQSVLSVLGAQTVPGWATGISPGPTNESSQTLTFLVSATNSGLFAVQPAVSANGTLTYRPALLAVGTSTVTVRLRDDGGSSQGGNDTSAPQTFTITIL